MQQAMDPVVSNDEHENSHRHYPTAEPTLRTAFDERLMEVLKAVAPTPQTQKKRLRVLTDLETVLASAGLRVEIFGSSVTGIITLDSDMDCMLVRRTDSHEKRATRLGLEALTRLDRALESAASAGSTAVHHDQKSVSLGIRVISNVVRRTRQFSGVVALTHAKVPIVKCVHCDTGINVDLSFVQDGVRSSQFLFTEYMRPGNELARALTVLVKTAVANRKLGDPSKGGLGSFPIALMVLFFLQTEVLENYPVELQHSPAILFTGFMKYYGKDFDFRRRGINYIQRKSFEKQPSQGLYIINPISAGSNCAKSATRYSSSVVPFFEKTADELCSLVDASVSEARLDGILGDIFQNVVLTYGSWPRVREAARNYMEVPQHMWDSKTNMYIGGLVDIHA